MDKDILVNLGRAVLVNFGPMSGKLAVIVDIVNSTKVVIDGPGLGVPRQVISNKRLSLTRFSLPEVEASTSSKDLGAKIGAFKLVERFEKTGLGQKIKKQDRRSKLTDFERFQVYSLKRQLGRAVRTQVNKSRKSLSAAAKSASKK